MEVAASNKIIKAGIRIHHWYIVKQVPKPKHLKTKGKYWLCKCDCEEQTERVILEGRLRSGRTKSCGCSKLENLTNKKFGRLSVIGKSNKRKSGETCWICICNCGNKNFILVTNSHLKDKKNGTKSCGCLQKEMARKASKKYNTYELSGNYGIGYTTKGEEFYFDLEDYNKIKDYCWWINAQGYLVSNDDSETIRMHRLIMSCQDDGKVVDHINGITVDNKKSNLRICTQQQNTMNSKIKRSNTSFRKGVYLDKRRDTWYAEITCKGKKHYLGSYELFDDAVEAREEAEKKYFGEYNRKEQ